MQRGSEVADPEFALQDAFLCEAYQDARDSLRVFWVGSGDPALLEVVLEDARGVTRAANRLGDPQLHDAALSFREGLSRLAALVRDVEVTSPEQRADELREISRLLAAVKPLNVYCGIDESVTAPPSVGTQ